MVNIIDIRTDNKSLNVKQMVLEGLSQPHGQRTLPTLILYDDIGLQLFDAITYLDEYYLTNAEIDILERKGDELVQNFIKDGSILLELGSGALRKTKLILDAIERNQRKVQYYALDLMEKELVKSLEALPSYQYVECFGLHGTYDDGIEYMKSFDPTKDKMVMWLGSSIGNFSRQEAGQFLMQVKEALNVGDKLLVGIDLRNEAVKVGKAYNDSEGISNQFLMNGLTNMNVIMEHELMAREKFEFISRVDDIGGYHESQYRCLESHTVSYEDKETGKKYKFEFLENELIHVEFSFKFNNQEIDELVQQVQVNWAQQMLDSTQSYSLNVFYKPPFFYDKPTTVVPTKSEWDELWKSWDYVCYHMLPKDMLLTRPIELRHPFIFYLGHIPAFLDIQLSKNDPNLPLTEPKSFAFHFERGIDPDVEDPTKCHDHSEVPDAWPSLDDIQSYQKDVRFKLDKVIKEEIVNRRLARVLNYVFEHQCMHLETLMYMLIQSDHLQKLNHLTCPPQVNQIQTLVPKANWVRSEINEVELGIDGVEDDDNSPQFKNNVVSIIGWDNESPKRSVEVNPFEFHNRPVTNFEYLQFLKATVNRNYPAQWKAIKLAEFEFEVKTLYGNFPLDKVSNWPVMVSYDQALAYCEFYNLRLPTEPEFKAMETVITTTSSTDDTATTDPNAKKLQIKRSLHYNTGFRNWTPVPVDNDQVSIYGDGWEWTSTPHQPFPNYLQSKLYPGYSMDFFDSKHHVLKGGSYLTHPRLLRSSFRNWFQKSYPYTFATFRPARTV